ncbi:helix-turn-helix domain-containing protein [Nonomuraea sp. NPDC046570]|uniref:helix-turn-helix domain-containing protein n=1 Tax=Nonomuraea sp. NPDC046570 TaxID=3155255 RepID=UPI0033D8EBE3
MDLQSRLDDLAARVGHGVSLDDPAGRLIAYSAQDAAVDPVRVAAILARQVAPEIRAWQDRHGVATATEPVRVPANPALGMSARICVPVRRDGRCLGYLWLLDPGSALDEAALADAVKAASDLAGMLAQAARDDLDECVGRLFAEQDADARDRLLARAPSLAHARLQVCVVVACAPDREAVRPMPARPPSLRRRPGYVGGFVTATHAAVLLRHPGEVGALPGFTQGFSEPCQVEGVPEAYRQALVAAELAALDPALPAEVGWAGLGPYRTLVGLPRGDGEALAGLEGTFLRTLETYLDLGGNAQRTAARLHLHRTTLYYRLGRVAAVLGVDLDDGLTRLDLHLALKRRRLARRTLG